MLRGIEAQPLVQLHPRDNLLQRMRCFEAAVRPRVVPDLFAGSCHNASVSRTATTIVASTRRPVTKECRGAVLGASGAATDSAEPAVWSTWPGVQSTGS